MSGLSQNWRSYAKNIFLINTTRNENGSYTVCFPFIAQSRELGNSQNKGIVRLLQLEKRLQKDTELKRAYYDFMLEYLKLGHMKEVSFTQNNEGKYYIPHQPVVQKKV